MKHAMHNDASNPTSLPPTETADAAESAAPTPPTDAAPTPPAAAAVDSTLEASAPAGALAKRPQVVKPRRVSRARTGLSCIQHQVLTRLLSGRSIVEAAEDTKVHRQTIHRWLRDNDRFRAMFNTWKNNIQANAKDRLAAGSDAIVSALLGAVEKGDAKIALALARDMKLTTSVGEAALEDRRLLHEERKIRQERQRADLIERKKKVDEDLILLRCGPGKSGLERHKWVTIPDDDADAPDSVRATEGPADAPAQSRKSAMILALRAQNLLDEQGGCDPADVPAILKIAEEFGLSMRFLDEEAFAKLHPDAAPAGQGPATDSNAADPGDRHE